MSNTELLPCPFCGGDAQTEQFESNTGLGHLVYAASCNNENCPIGHKDHGAFERKSDAIKAWNTRAPIPRIEGLEDSIEGAEHDYRVGNTVSPNDFDDIIKAALSYAKLQANITKKGEQK